MRSTEPGCFRSCSWSLWKALDNEGCIGLFLWHLDLLCMSSWILNDFFTENFRGIGMCLWCCLERSWWARFNGIYLVRFGFRMWGEILIFYWFLKWFLSLKKIQINSQKNQVLEGKIGWGRGKHLGQQHRPHTVVQIISRVYVTCLLCLGVEKK